MATPGALETSQSQRSLSVDDLIQRGEVTIDRLNAIIKEKDLYDLAGFFESVTDGYLTKFQLNPGQCTDVKHIAASNGTQAGICEALKLWVNHNPYEATYKALLDIVLSQKQGMVAVKICKYLSNNCKS